MAKIPQKSPVIITSCLKALPCNAMMDVTIWRLGHFNSTLQLACTYARTMCKKERVALTRLSSFYSAPFGHHLESHRGGETGFHESGHRHDCALFTGRQSSLLSCGLTFQESPARNMVSLMNDQITRDFSLFEYVKYLRGGQHHLRFACLLHASGSPN